MKEFNWNRAHSHRIPRVTPASLLLLLLLRMPTATALDTSVSHVGGDRSRELLGDGTNVVVGVVDSGIDATHPTLATLDSLGRDRVVAQMNFVATEADNTGDDPNGHGTAVTSIIAGADFEFQGFAPDARLVNARALNANNSFDFGRWPEDATGWAIEQDVDVLNLSLNFFSSLPESSQGDFTLDRMLDWAAYQPRYAVSTAVCAGNIASGDEQLPTPRAPGGAFNVIVVGQTGQADFRQVHQDSAYGPTSDGRIKPDVVAPGRSITTANSHWEEGVDFVSLSGCSFATPHVTGLLTQLVDFGKSQGISTDPRLLKVVVMNTAEKVLDRDGQPWEPFQSEVIDGVWRSTSPLDEQIGAGQLDALMAARQYTAGQQRPGRVPTIGWALETIAGEAFHEYSFHVSPGSDTRLAATMSWLRHVEWVDAGDGHIGSDDEFRLGLDGDALDNLDLTLLHEGLPLAMSVSEVDNVEHLYWSLSAGGEYTLRVSREFVEGAGDDEAYALAWAVRGFRGDFDRSGQIDVADIDLLSQAIRAAATDADYDLSGDGVVDHQDHGVWVDQFAVTYLGDANLDGVFDSSDLTLVFIAGEYEDGLAANSTWASGDWTGDAEFSTGDLVAAFQANGYEQGPRPASAAAVPEPISGGRWLAGGLLWLARHRRRPRRV